jgi:hypothetical protein
MRPAFRRFRHNARGMTRLTWKQVMAFRARRHGLDARAPRSAMLKVAARICGLHAQLMSSAELTLWARLEGLRPGAVRKALWEDRALVKMWAMRGTLHLLPAAEFSLWQAALSTYGHFLKPAWLRWCGITLDDVEKLVLAVGAALDGRTLTRGELAAEVSRRTRSRLGDKLLQSWGMTLKPATYRGNLCFAPSRGANVCFTLPRWWLKGARAKDPQRARSEIIGRFLSLNGPATRDEVGRWWGAQAAPAQKLIEAHDVTAVDVEGTRAFALSRDLRELSEADPPRSVRLLPAFDQFVIMTPRRAPLTARERIYRPQGWISPVLLVGGRMAGLWRLERKGRRAVVQLEPFGRLERWARSAAEEEAERLAAFSGAELHRVDG